jgi:hypothetical protein
VTLPRYSFYVCFMCLSSLRLACFLAPSHDITQLFPGLFQGRCMLYFPIGTCRHLQPYKPTIVIFPSHVFTYCVSFVSPKCSLPSPLPHIVSVCCKNATQSSGRRMRQPQTGGRRYGWKTEMKIKSWLRSVAMLSVPSIRPSPLQLRRLSAQSSRRQAVMAAAANVTVRPVETQQQLQEFRMVMRAYLGGPHCLPSIEPCFGSQARPYRPWLCRCIEQPSLDAPRPAHAAAARLSTPLPHSVHAALSLQNG